MEEEDIGANPGFDSQLILHVMQGFTHGLEAPFQVYCLTLGNLISNCCSAHAEHKHKVWRIVSFNTFLKKLIDAWSSIA